MYYLSPLRYPGGKGTLAPFLGRLITSQPVRPITYVEPFAGGAGAALRLLYDEYIDHVVLNDLDPGIAALWRVVFRRTAELEQLIRRCRVTVAEWRRQRAIYTNSEGRGDLELGFATLFLNRTNRSGILSARPIGGLKQTGAWKIDARFDRKALIDRVRMLGRYRNRVTILQEDGVGMVGSFLTARQKTFAYVDPPYLTQGSELYLDTLKWPDHQRLARVLQRGRGSWLVTYDLDERVLSELYPGRRCAAFDIAHTAAVQHVGSEYAVFADSIHLDALEGLGTKNRRVGSGWTT